jgi:hypothetical protein
MSWIKKVVVFCESCDNEYHYEGRTVSVAEREAMDNGWKEDRGEHWCPECQQEDDEEEEGNGKNEEDGEE